MTFGRLRLYMLVGVIIGRRIYSINPGQFQALHCAHDPCFPLLKPLSRPSQQPSAMLGRG